MILGFAFLQNQKCVTCHWTSFKVHCELMPNFSDMYQDFLLNGMILSNYLLFELAP